MARSQAPARAQDPKPAVAADQGRRPAPLPPRELTAFLEKQSDRIAKVLPRHLTPERMIQVVSLIYYKTPKLQLCTPDSILFAALKACTLGLDLTPEMGEAHLIPRKNRDTRTMECHFQPGYRGLAKLARNSGGIVYIKSMLVHARDSFFYRYTPDLEFNHTPYLASARGGVTHAYCVAKLPTGEHLIEVMTTDELEEIHRRSEYFRMAMRDQEPETGPWVTDWGEMAKKTPLKRLAKSLPMSPELAEAIAADNVEYGTYGGESTGRRVVPARRGLAALGGRLGIEDQSLPPQGTRTYSESDDPAPVPDPQAAEEASQESPGDAPGEGGEGWPEGRE